MSVQIDIVYQGQLRCEATHAPSKNHFVTDAPVDNMGKGESFSPTDLVATALGTCMITTMGIFAQRHDVNLSGATLTVRKHMVSAPSRRIGKLETEIHVPLPANHPYREALERAAMTCPVFLSLHPDVEKSVAWTWQG